MYTSDNDLQVSIDGGTTWTNLLPYTTEVKWGWYKMWGSDTGRNLKGKFSGTFIGIFPKITITFGTLSKAQLNTLAPILDSKYQKIKYYDPNKNQLVTMNTYTGDWENTQNNIVVNQTFSISFIAQEKRA